MKPVTKYVKSGSINIAYQIVGQGNIDLIYVPGWVSNIDMMWVDSKIADFLTKLTRFSRLNQVAHRKFKISIPRPCVNQSLVGFLKGRDLIFW